MTVKEIFVISFDHRNLELATQYAAILKFSKHKEGSIMCAGMQAG